MNKWDDYVVGFGCLSFLFMMGPVAQLLVIRNARRCRHRVKATLTKMEFARSKRFSGNGKSWQTEFSYTYKDVDYKAVPPCSDFRKRYEVGQEVEIYINEEHPEEYYFPKDGKALILIFTPFTLLFIVFLISFIKKLL